MEESKDLGFETLPFWTGVEAAFAFHFEFEELVEAEGAFVAVGAVELAGGPNGFGGVPAGVVDLGAAGAPKGLDVTELEIGVAKEKPDEGADGAPNGFVAGLEDVLFPPNTPSEEAEEKLPKVNAGALPNWPEVDCGVGAEGAPNFPVDGNEEAVDVPNGFPEVWPNTAELV